MSDISKIQILKIIILEKNCQNLQVCYFRYVICEKQPLDNSGRFLCIVNAIPSSLWCFEKSKVFVTCVCLQTQPKYFQKLNLEKKSSFWFMEKHLSYNFNIMKNATHRDFGTTVIKWSLEKATVRNRSRMHFVSHNFENNFVNKLFISKM